MDEFAYIPGSVDPEVSSRWLPLGQGAGQHIPHLSEEPQDVPQTW